MKRFESREDYLERILQISRVKENVRAIDVVHAMGFSKPSVSIAMAKLRDECLIDIDEHGYIKLTLEGLEIAEKTLDKHESIVKLLIRLGVSEATATEDACRIEHDISDETWRVIRSHVNHE